MAVPNIEEVRAALQAYVDARSRLMDAGTDACLAKGLYPNMRNIWQTILMETFGPHRVGEKAMDLSAGIMQLAEDHMKRAKMGVQFEGPDK